MMRVLFDQGTPVPIRPFLIGHTVRRNIRYQQSLTGRPIAIVVVGVQQWPALEPHTAHVVAAANAETPGSCTEGEIPPGTRSTQRTTLH